MAGTLSGADARRAREATGETVAEDATIAVAETEAAGIVAGETVVVETAAEETAKEADTADNPFSTYAYSNLG